MFETSSVNHDRRKFHPLTFLVSTLLHLVAIGAVTFFTIWEVETPERAPNQIADFHYATAPAIPPPPKISKGDPEGEREKSIDEAKDEPRVPDDRAPTDIPAVIDEPDGDDSRRSKSPDVPFGSPDGDAKGDPAGSPDGVVGGVGEGPGGGVLDDRTYDVGAGVRAPVVTHRVEPVYPPLLQRIGKSGIVTIQCVISKSGQLTDIRVVHASHPLFAQSALDAVKQWGFLPGTLDGRPVATRFDFTVNFDLVR